jgi:hypothetical protein
MSVDIDVSRSDDLALDVDHTIGVIPVLQIPTDHLDRVTRDSNVRLVPVTSASVNDDAVDEQNIEVFPRFNLLGGGRTKQGGRT